MWRRTGSQEALGTRDYDTSFSEHLLYFSVERGIALRRERVGDLRSAKPRP